MPIKLLDATSAWSEGADLWFVSNHRPANWLLRIDWHLGFQLTTAESMPPISLPLMVAAANSLPTQQVVLVSCCGAREVPHRWADQCIEVWKRLGEPSARLFTDDERVCDTLLKHWPDTTTEVTIVGP